MILGAFHYTSSTRYAGERDSGLDYQPRIACHPISMHLMRERIGKLLQLPLSPLLSSLFVINQGLSADIHPSEPFYIRFRQSKHLTFTYSNDPYPSTSSTTYYRHNRRPISTGSCRQYPDTPELPARNNSSNLRPTSTDIRRRIHLTPLPAEHPSFHELFT